MKRLLPVLLLFAALAGTARGQQGGTVRGNVYDKQTGEPIIFGTVFLEGTEYGTNTDENGFFSMGNIPPGKYRLVATYIGYDSVAVDIDVRAGRIVQQQLYMVESSVNLSVVDVSARKEKARSEVAVSAVSISPRQIEALPSIGGQTDLAQYLPVLPGIITTGDQGGQIYIRGGSPIQNRILLDGMTIFNPFHSIGLFSVFETETIRTIDVLTGGFGAEHGGRISAVVDIKTREGNKTKFSGQVAANPFQSKALFEGPIRRFDAGKGGGSSSFLLTAKRGYIDQTSPVLYPWITSTATDSVGLPYSYTDVYGKVSFLAGNGTQLNLFGFNFTDAVNFEGVAALDWTTTGFGSNFKLVPPNSNIVIDGVVAFSDYRIGLKEADEAPRSSAITNYSVQLNFNYFGRNSELRYGFDFSGLETDFVFKNLLGVTIRQNDFTTELAGYVTLKQIVGRWVLQPGLRAQFYVSQPATSLEPRLGAKFNATERLRFKFAGGLYSQNILSSVNERDVINLFVGFLSGPEQTIYRPGTTEPTPHRLQKAQHAIAGFEADLADRWELNVEGYFKNFSQLIQVNRNKRSERDPDFTTETGEAWGVDVSLRYADAHWYVWTTYSLGHVRRDDGEQVYPTIFDRRHNVNLLVTRTFGEEGLWEAALRWNLGTGFPFTLTQGFYENFNFEDGITTDVLTGNGSLGVIFDTRRNAGRLPDYHRLDLSLKRIFHFGESRKLEVTASVTNAYNRENIFFFDRVRYKRVNQLPILPSLGLSWQF